MAGASTETCATKVERVRPSNAVTVKFAFTEDPNPRKHSENTNKSNQLIPESGQ